MEEHAGRVFFWLAVLASIVLCTGITSVVSVVQGHTILAAATAFVCGLLVLPCLLLAGEFVMVHIDD